ncbi:hypothetical protein DGWBC_0728 [Dehalogenimonas sp. WBC-2]|nr:hypothetical protein DGWBC_0728 [Dehalogenimonas sp. WBC-2]
MDCGIDKDELRQFMRQFAGDYESREMLRLLGRHPFTRFNRLALADSLRMRLCDVDRAINHLKDKGLLITIDGQKTALYTLTAVEPWHDMVRKTAEQDYCQFLLEASSI